MLLPYVLAQWGGGACSFAGEIELQPLCQTLRTSTFVLFTELVKLTPRFKVENFIFFYCFPIIAIKLESL